MWASWSYYCWKECDSNSENDISSNVSMPYDMIFHFLDKRTRRRNHIGSIILLQVFSSILESTYYYYLAADIVPHFSSTKFIVSPYLPHAFVGINYWISIMDYISQCWQSISCLFPVCRQMSSLIIDHI